MVGIGGVGTSILVLQIGDVYMFPAITRVKLVTVVKGVCAGVLGFGDGVHGSLARSGGTAGQCREDNGDDEGNMKHDTRLAKECAWGLRVRNCGEDEWQK